jgi:hypothetical protein
VPAAAIEPDTNTYLVVYTKPGTETAVVEDVVCDAVFADPQYALKFAFPNHDIISAVLSYAAILDGLLAYVNQ